MSGTKENSVLPPSGAVLIAEDNQDDVKLLFRDLQQMGVSHSIQSVADGDQVLAYLKGSCQYADREKFPYPIILVLDLRMKPGDGFSVLRWLKDNPSFKTFPVLVLTAWMDRSAMIEAYRLGAATFLTKPFTRDALAAAFRELKVLHSQPESAMKAQIL
jgi:two-component system response regulator